MGIWCLLRDMFWRSTPHRYYSVDPAADISAPYDFNVTPTNTERLHSAPTHFAPFLQRHRYLVPGIRLSGDHLKLSEGGFGTIQVRDASLYAVGTNSSLCRHCKLTFHFSISCEHYRITPTIWNDTRQPRFRRIALRLGGDSTDLPATGHPRLLGMGGSRSCRCNDDRLVSSPRVAQSDAKAHPPTRLFRTTTRRSTRARIRAPRTSWFCFCRASAGLSMDLRIN